MKYLRLKLNYEVATANDPSGASLVELFKSLQDNGFFSENGIIQYEDERVNELKGIFEKYYSTIKAENNEENQV